MRIGEAARETGVTIKAIRHYEAREQVAAFHRAALDAGGRDNGAPGSRPSYGAAYFATFAYDPDGHNLEAVVVG